MACPARPKRPAARRRRLAPRVPGGGRWRRPAPRHSRAGPRASPAPPRPAAPLRPAWKCRTTAPTAGRRGRVAFSCLRSQWSFKESLLNQACDLFGRLIGNRKDRAYIDLTKHVGVIADGRPRPIEEVGIPDDRKG